MLMPRTLLAERCVRMLQNSGGGFPSQFDPELHGRQVATVAALITRNGPDARNWRDGIRLFPAVQYLFSLLFRPADAAFQERVNPLGSQWARPLASACAVVAIAA